MLGLLVEFVFKVALVLNYKDFFENGKISIFTTIIIITPTTTKMKHISCFGL